jgi:hypothetical protein
MALVFNVTCLFLGSALTITTFISVCMCLVWFI